MADVSFCLLMIVKNEASIIYRALDSLRNVIGSYYIHDTGSNDGTQEIINTFGVLNNIPGYVENRSWKNFGENKTDLIQSAQKHSDPKISKAKYYVWLDADEVWITERSNPLSYVTKEQSTSLLTKLESIRSADIFMLLTLYDGLEYRRWNLCRNNQVYKWVQPVHEYFVGETRNSTHFIEDVFLLARKEGNSAKNPDRYKKDVEMFIEFLKENPNETRATFYLAQSLERIDDNLANETYKARIKLEGYYEEKYISCLRLGRRLKDEKEKIKYLIEGTFINPNRLECYYELMMHYYYKNDHKKAVGYGMMAPENRAITTGFLFSEPSIYNYSFDLHYGVSLYNVGMYDIGLKVTENALRFAGLPAHIKKTLEANVGFFKKKMETPVISHFSKEVCPSVVVVDGFYEDPMKVRETALSMEFKISGNFPSLRTEQMIYPGTKERFEKILNKKITYWPIGEKSYNGSFQYCLEKHSSWTHRDALSYSCVIYLTPNAPYDSGTKLRIHKATNKSYTNGDKDLETILNKDSHIESAWWSVDTIGNIFNRACIFKGFQSHISDRYFGNTLENGRLFQTFFFSVEE
jgi:hypothetical protein